MYRNTYATINLEAITNNVRKIIDYSQKEFHYAVVKANGYGHGAVEVAAAAIEGGATHLAVAFLDEAMELRKEFPNIPILILGYTDSEYFELAAKYALTLTITNMTQVDKLVNYAGKTLKIHFKVNSGMNRLGFSSLDEVKQAYVKLRYSSDIDTEGIFTHFATAGAEDTGYYVKQAKLFTKVVEELGSFFKIIHCQNSAAVIYPVENFDYCNAARIGIAMYGCNPSDNKDLPIELDETMAVYSHVSSILKLKKGAKIGYGATYTMEKAGVIATIPIGYADGIIRAYEGLEVIINKKRYPIVGRVCMDQLMVLVDDTVKLGNQVEFFGNLRSINEVSRYLGTIDYEVLCLISDRVPRLYIEANDISSVKYFRYKDLV